MRWITYFRFLIFRMILKFWSFGISNYFNYLYLFRFLYYIINQWNFMQQLNQINQFLTLFKRFLLIQLLQLREHVPLAGGTRPCGPAYGRRTALFDISATFFAQLFQFLSLFQISIIALFSAPAIIWIVVIMSAQFKYFNYLYRYITVDALLKTFELLPAIASKDTESKSFDCAHRRWKLIKFSGNVS